MSVIRSYNGYFTFGGITDEQRSRISELSSAERFNIDLSERSLEFESTGRDASRAVVETFREIAGILKDADGELRCEIDEADVDPHFEFFTIKGGQLLIQQGRLVRECEASVV
jgi:hypothetical protein